MPSTSTGSAPGTESGTGHSRQDQGGDPSAVDTAGVVHRALAAEVRRARERGRSTPVVLDVGGGSGAWAVELARLGCSVTVVDTSPDALASLQRRARDAGVAGRVVPVSGDAETLAEVAPRGGADLVLGHGLLEVVDDAAGTARALAAAVAPGGAVSLLTAGRHAAVLGRTLSGRIAEARALLTDPHGRLGDADPLRRRLDAGGLRSLVEAAGLVPELVQGDGVLTGWAPGPVRDGGPAATRALAEVETLAAARPELLEIATRLHVLARRPV